ncbi:hypothetical protein B0T18DRAFT_397690 [Schizothecium vesticola]|uniref:C2H2-type domain-containing protein n=1 Tax=Schizothecium vesticola TaxID=314040 RepID=A0AA40F9J4_9PEZI|nr:hypothetical protein B0T18DRAFT_397690 [Schizothecium vesticola]
MSLSALELASDAAVRAVLFALCADNTIKKKALGLLSVLEPNAAHLAANYVAHNSAPLKRKAKRKTKRKAKRQAIVQSMGRQVICWQCQDLFDEEENHLKKCCYHPGEKESYVQYLRNNFNPDLGFAAEMFGTNLIGLAWSCCGKKGDEVGCRFSRHVSSNSCRSKLAKSSTGVGDDDVESLSSWTVEEEKSDQEESEEEESGEEESEEESGEKEEE